MALAIALIAAVVIFAAPAWAATLLGVSIPEIQDVTGGHLGVHVAASDVVLVLIGARLLADGVARPQLASVRVLRSVRFPVLQYAWLIGVLLVIHLSGQSALKSAQRLELFVLPLLVGAFIALRRQHMLVLRGYVLAATLLAIVWPFLNAHGLAGQFQKNPTGGMIVSAILLLLAVPALRRLLWCGLPLLVGLGLTASRGALLALVVGIVVIGLMRAGARQKLVARTLALLVTAVMVVPFLPSSVTSRLTNFSSAAPSSAAALASYSASSWAIYYRDAYWHDAEALIAKHPFTGVGVGNYLAGSTANLTQTTDPHDVILLEAAEGGYVFAASFVILVLGVAFALWRMRRVELAPAAAGVLLATVAHGMVDVYWVRAGPVLGWLLVGMVCGLAAQRAEQRPDGPGDRVTRAADPPVLATAVR